MQLVESVGYKRRSALETHRQMAGVFIALFWLLGTKIANVHLLPDLIASANGVRDEKKVMHSGVDETVRNPAAHILWQHRRAA
jgi:hypothetical protein